MTKKQKQKKEANANCLSGEERQLLEQLRKHPEIKERVQKILRIADDDSQQIKCADEVEGLLVDEMRRLGNTTMASWAQRTEERLAEELKQADASARIRKKKR